jgi:Fic family protein
VQATVAIEGGTLDEAHVTALLDGQRVVGSASAIAEVTNALRAYEAAPRWLPARSRDLLAAHAVLMKGLSDEAGRFRRGGVGIFQGDHVAHVAPPAARVPQLVEDLLDFVARDKEVSLLLRAALCHYEIEFIHPFADGNGRIGRLWQHRIHLDLHPVFAHVPVESTVRDRQRDYYAALGASDRNGDAAPFLAFSLRATCDALEEFAAELRPEPATAATRLARARAHFGSATFARGDYARLFPTMSLPTASRDLRTGVDDGDLQREGRQATTRYRFR